jgi:hypothetical protein
MECITSFNQNILRHFWPLDIGCTCQPLGLYSVVLSFIIIGVLAFFLYKKEMARHDQFFIYLLVGFMLLGISEVIDWWQSAMVSHAGVLLFFPNVYMMQELFRLAGFFIIFITIFKSQKRL